MYVNICIYHRVNPLTRRRSVRVTRRNLRVARRPRRSRVNPMTSGSRVRVNPWVNPAIIYVCMFVYTWIYASTMSVIPYMYVRTWVYAFKISMIFFSGGTRAWRRRICASRGGSSAQGCRRIDLLIVIIYACISSLFSWLGCLWLCAQAERFTVIYISTHPFTGLFIHVLHCAQAERFNKVRLLVCSFTYGTVGGARARLSRVGASRGGRGAQGLTRWQAGQGLGSTPGLTLT